MGHTNKAKSCQYTIKLILSSFLQENIEISQRLIVLVTLNELVFMNANGHLNEWLNFFILYKMAAGRPAFLPLLWRVYFGGALLWIPQIRNSKIIYYILIS